MRRAFPLPARNAFAALTTIGALVAVAADGVAQSHLSFGPFVTLDPSAGSAASGGLTLSTVSGPLGFRIGAFASLDEELLSERGWRPWGGDLDLMLHTGSGLLAPYVFGGVGIAGRDSLGSMVSHGNWSYGAGIMIPLGSTLELSGESRTRHRNAAWPTSTSPTGTIREYRIGASLRFGGAGSRRNRSGGILSPGSAETRTGRRSGSGAGGGIVLPGSAPAARVLPTAEQYLGVKYVYGGTSPTGGFDCSGFTQYVFAKHGVQLPRTSRQQVTAGSRVAAVWETLLPGDLVMFANPGEAISHVAIYAGDDRIIHSTSSGGGVRYDDLGTRRGQWFAENIVAARRITQDGRGLILDFAKAFGGVIDYLDPPDRAPRK